MRPGHRECGTERPSRERNGDHGAQRSNWSGSVTLNGIKFGTADFIVGSERHDICGVDFRAEDGDHGDEDLRLSLAALREHDRNPALVAFGHMHHRLSTRHGLHPYNSIAALDLYAF